MGRKGPSGIELTAYASYATAAESGPAMGWGNGGTTDQWMDGLKKE